MTAYTDALDAIGSGPKILYRMNEASGGLVDSASGRHMTQIYGSPNYGLPGPFAAPDSSTAIGIAEDGSGLEGFRSALGFTLFSTGVVSFNFLWKRPSSGFAANKNVFNWQSSNNYFECLCTGVASAVTFTFNASYYGTLVSVTSDPLPDDDDWHMVTLTMDVPSDATMRTYVDAVAGPTASTGAFINFWGGSSYMYIGRSETNHYIRGELCGITAYEGTAWSPAQVSSVFASISVVGDSLNLPMLLEGFLTYAAANLPMRLLGAGLYPQQNLPMQLNGIDSNESAVTALYYDIAVALDGVEITDLVGTIAVQHQERSSGLAKFQFIPPAGAIDPDAFERKSVTVTYRRVTSTGALIYQSRRFTGTSSSAYYDPDSGIVRVEATTDLQGQVENMTREGIAAVIDTAQWSDHIFDDSADGWQYAQDLMSTTPYDVHVAEEGGLVSVPWAAKATADLELSDDQVEDLPISLTRAKRRDLLTRVKLNIDFRFVRLRHREIAVLLPETYSFCDWLNNGMNLPSKSMVQSAADSSPWTRISDISFNTFPSPGTYCTPPRGWVGGAEEFCLTASWTAARRWAQTVTEEYALYVYSPDMEESAGRQEVNEDYGVEATYDSTDYEKIVEFDAPPTGAVYDTNSEDWTKDATDAEADGRLAMEDAQVVAMARANTTILDRARRNRLSFYPVYNPFITLDKTLRLNTTYAQAKGKIFRLQEKYDMDTGQLLMKTELALSRHGGSGFGADEPQTPPAEPAPPTETPSARTYVLPWRVGGVSSGQPADDPDWDGYMTNVDVNIRDPAAPIYSQRLVVEMPEIEEAARNATAAQAEQLYTIAVPEDELTMSY